VACAHQLAGLRQPVQVIKGNYTLMGGRLARRAAPGAEIG
jgi:hypothetical protein